MGYRSPVARWNCETRPARRSVGRGPARRVSIGVALVAVAAAGCSSATPTTTPATDPTPTTGPPSTTIVTTTTVAAASTTTADASATTTGVPATTTTMAPAPPDCSVTREGAVATIRWADRGGVDVVRRDGSWLATPEVGVTSYVDPSSPPGSTYEVRTWIDDLRIDRPCDDGTTPSTTAPPPSSRPGERVADLVVHVSIDGLRADHVTPTLMPNLSRLRVEGASTLNARTDPAETRTLPNHHSQFTGRPVRGPDGHGVDVNDDRGTTVHDEAGGYVASVFDVVHDHGGRTLVYAGKPKFDMIDRNWDAEHGAPDTTGADDGRDKIDVYERVAPEVAVGLLAEQLATDDQVEYVFFHIRTPDEVGHASTWASPEYAEGVRRADAILGDVIALIDADPERAARTAIVVVADHGGPAGRDRHDDATVDENFTIPFVVRGPGVAPGSDLYELNPTTRTDPGDAQVGLDGPQPIREHEVANLVLRFLGYPPVPGSTFGDRQELVLN